MNRVPRNASDVSITMPHQPDLFNLAEGWWMLSSRSSLVAWARPPTISTPARDRTEMNDDSQVPLLAKFITVKQDA
ncbi:hypothetical protein [Roseimaritima ulvae]|uniref:Uncharacterized protein n=1 Tax=Roseimaritima ulvae TaxID=980254 RepID=A0A5B9QPA3_9BACT|nr:hypothetical protein [Roseimaritima ulvae]QEG40794.1 hypothetical protein UC8_28120 [Roseimaritima ulvae]